MYRRTALALLLLALGTPVLEAQVYKDRITPHWFADNAFFWYRNYLPKGAKEFVLVDAVNGKRTPAFDHDRLAKALSKAAKKKYQADRLPFEAISFDDERKRVSFRVGSTRWTCDLGDYTCVAGMLGDAQRQLDRSLEAEARAAKTHEEEQSTEQVRVARAESILPDGPAPSLSATAVVQPPPRRQRGESPDGKWYALIRDHNIWVRAGDKETQLTKDGKANRGYGMLRWSPDSTRLVAFRIEPGDRKQVHLIESSPRGGGRARLRSREYPLPGDKFTSYTLAVFDVAKAKRIPTKVEPIDFGRPRLRWRKDGHTFTYEKHDRGHQRYRLMQVDAHTGKSDTIIDEKSETFIWSAHFESFRDPRITWLEKTDEIIYVSEKTGWRHLFLLDSRTGEVKAEITPGEYVVRGIDKIDEDKRQVWFRACGKNPDQDPYLIHYYRVDFDGSNLVELTKGNGTHRITYSPDRKYIIDRYDRVDSASVHELRRVSDGKKMCDLERADVSELRKRGWSPPEVFVAKGRDGKTDIWGIIERPKNFDPKKKYPVIENIYAGPHGSHVPKRFSSRPRYSSLTNLGFVVVKIDGMGTANRSKAFHDVCWKNLADAGFPDRVLWHKAVAKKYPWYDTSRVGIYGGSAGGQNAMGGLLFHPEMYKVGVATCGCHDNRMDKASWNEQWMGYPVGPQYAKSSNVDNAHRLKGKLLLIVGELDTNVPPESTMRVVDALIRADKDFDLIVIPNGGHGSGRYGYRRMLKFFEEHLR